MAEDAHDAHDAHDPTGFDEPSAGRAVEARGTGVSRWSLLVLVLAVLLAIVLGQNTERVDVEVLWASFEAPLFLVVVLAALGVTVCWELATLAFRHRRRRKASASRV